MYVGKTGKFLRRLKEHQRDVNNNIAANALAEHEVYNHNIDWDSAAIIAKET